MDGIVDIAAGDGFSMAVNTSGELFAWGLNDIGQLGDGTNVNRATPVKIMDDVVFIDAHRYTSIAITSDGTLWRWGNDITRLGWDFYFATPRRVTDNVQTASAGGDTILILTNDSRLYGIGAVDNLGIGDRGRNLFMSQPTYIMSNIRDVVADNQRVFAITMDDRLYGWGPNGSDGGVGDGGEFWVYEPAFVMDNVRAVFPGSIAIRNDNSLWAWGSLYDGFTFRGVGSDGQTTNRGGMMMENIVIYGPRPVHLMDNVLTADGVSFGHFLAVSTDMNLYSWGQNQFGQLGTGRVNVYRFGEPYEWDTPIYLDQDHNEASPVRIGSVSGQ